MSEATVAKNGGGEEQKRCKLHRDQIGSLFHELNFILHWQRQRNIGPKSAKRAVDIDNDTIANAKATNYSVGV